MQKIIKNVIVPVNFSTSSACAINTGIAMCKRHNATLHLLHVDNNSSFPYAIGRKAFLIDIRLKAWQINEAAMEARSKEISYDNDIVCYYHISAGHFAQTVAKVAKDFYCDIIVLERSVKSLFTKIFQGNSGYKIMENADCPVMIIPGDFDKTQFDSILFPVWPENNTLSKLIISLPIIKKNRAKVTLLGSIRTRDSLTECATVNRLTTCLGKIISLTNRHVEQEMSPTPRTAKTIIFKALEKNSDLIIISAVKQKSINHLFKRSYIEEMVESCPVPILSVK